MTITQRVHIFGQLFSWAKVINFDPKWAALQYGQIFGTSTSGHPACDARRQEKAAISCLHLVERSSVAAIFPFGGPSFVRRLRAQAAAVDDDVIRRGGGHCGLG
jgi:hypothetical protein